MDQPDHEIAPTESISVDIYDQIYHLRGTDTPYLEHLAELVDGKMRAVAAHGGTVDSLRVAVLASLNIADELESLRSRHAALTGSMAQTQTSLRSRSASLAAQLDQIFDEAEPSIRRAG